MSRAALFMKQLNVLDPDHELADPTGDRYYRHVLDWLREPTYEGYPHWEHTTRADDAWNLAEYGESSEGGCYTSDEDEEALSSGPTSDKDEGSRRACDALTSLADSLHPASGSVMPCPPRVLLCACGVRHGPDAPW